MRILIIVENLPVPFDRRVWQEAKSLVRAGFEVAVICPTGKGYTTRFESIDGVKIYRHPLPIEARGPIGYVLEYGAALFWESWLALKIFITHGFDVIHACNPPDLIFLVALPYRLLFGRTFVFDHHDLCPELAEAKFGKATFTSRLLRASERLTFALADRSIATNDSYRDIAINRGRMSPEHVAVVRSGPDLERLQRVPPDARWRGGFDHLVGYVGVMGKQEGLAYLLEAARIMVREHGRRDVKFLLVGEGPELKALKDQTVALDLENYVEFAGRIPDAELVSALRSCDVCVNPDEFNTMNNLSTMNKIMEYMALERPIVQFELKEGRVSAGDASLYARPNDAHDLATNLLRLIDDPDLRLSMGRLGRQRVETMWAWPHQEQILISFYREISERHSHKAHLSKRATKD